MSTTVFNLSSAAVTQYDTAFTGLAGDYEATADGLCKVGGLLDDDTEITSLLTFGLHTPEKSTKQQRPQYLYLFGTGLDGASAVIGDAKGNSHLYDVQQQVHGRASRFILGRGLRGNYLKVCVSFPGTEDVNLDRAEFLTATSDTRRM